MRLILWKVQLIILKLSFRCKIVFPAADLLAKKAEKSLLITRREQ
jgi:hypothetical protein